MPVILLLFGCGLIVCFVKNFRVVMSLSLIIFVSIFFILIKNDKNFKHAYGVLFSDINIIKQFKNNNDVSTKENEEKKAVEKISTRDVPQSIIFLKHSGYSRIYNTSFMMWQERPLTGFGLKSLRFKCWDMMDKDNVEREISKKPQYIVCANHAHNYYLELLSEAGIIGTSLLVIFFLILLKNSFHFLKKHNQKISSDTNFLIPVIIVFLIEIWPIKSTGSFFTTWGATFFWLNIGLLISGLSRKT